MTLLNQIIALEKGARAHGSSVLTKTYHELQRAAQMSGIARTYRPKDEDGEQLPPERTLVQVKVTDLMDGLADTLGRLFDLTLTKDTANQTAKADIVVDGEVLVSDVPVSTLLFLEKNFVDLHTLVSKLPLLDPGETWVYDETADVYASEPVETARTKKVPRNHVKAEATDRHPAQVEMWYEDVTVGFWRTVKFSGALSASEKASMLSRLRTLTDAVKVAREQANTTSVVDRPMGSTIFEYLLTGSR